ncbi:MAG: hypothetical protein JWM11_7223 [Planctomycetaceae bacterium]|nr:hypothetical protein [Planctomycetaceae bacterium]
MTPAAESASRTKVCASRRKDVKLKTTFKTCQLETDMFLPSSLETTETQRRCDFSRQMTELDFVSWVMSDETRAEWVNGEVILTSPAALRHVEITSWLQQVLGLFIHAKRLGKLLGPEYMIRLEHLGISRRVTDLLFVAQANFAHGEKKSSGRLTRLGN